MQRDSNNSSAVLVQLARGEMVDHSEIGHRKATFRKLFGTRRTDRLGIPIRNVNNRVLW
jgi:hypothetical protein